MRKVTQNILLSLAINIVAVTLSVCGILNPVTGALMHNCGSVLVVVNAALLLREKDK
jgi:cation transport ATPase